MPFITSEEVKEIRNAIKKAFPKFKFSITKRHYSGVQVDILKGPINFELGENRQYRQVNKYYIKETYKGEEFEFLTKLFEIIDGIKEQRELVYDGDYGSVPNYYKNVSIGKWDKPYICTEIKEEKKAEYSELVESFLGI